MVSSVFAFVIAMTLPGTDDARLDQAHVHLQKGRFAEALEAFDRVRKEHPDSVKAIIGAARVHLAQGRLQEAAGLLEPAADTAKHPSVLAELARLRFLRGDYANALALADSAIAIETDHPLGRLVRAHCLTETGRLDDAEQAWRWFVRFYNRSQPEDAETLVVIAEGAAQYARWKSSTQIFGFIVNTLCPDALKADPNCWRSALQSGRLLLEKYNRAQGVPELHSGLAINPRAAEIHVELGRSAYEHRDFDNADTFADRALAVNPRLVAGLNLKADILLARGNIAQTEAVVARALAINPVDQRTLARQAILILIADGVPDAERLSRLLRRDAQPQSDLAATDRFEQMLRDLYQRNPRPGDFLTILAGHLDDRRQFERAEICLRAAINTMPQLSRPRTLLGMLLMQTGRTTEARQVLDAAFKADPYHVRVSNIRKVLKVLESYSTITTDHFVIHFDSKADRIPAKLVAEYLESIYDELVTHYGFEPPHRTHFEIYHNAGGLDAHQWFSARMIGLPWIQTIGASTGMVVALTSPTAMKDKYNWARVLRHEFVHVITLQQTGFNCPHWFTEALAVTTEGIENPVQWYKLMAERVPGGRLWRLDELNGIFAAAPTPDDWQFAYCQSRMYARYIIENFGEGHIQQMLDGYRDGESTDDVIQAVFEQTPDEFDKGYRRFLRSELDASGAALASFGPRPASLSAARKAWIADRTDIDAGAAYAQVLLDSGKVTEARRLADEILKGESGHPTASFVAARLELKAGRLPGALQILRTVDSRRHSPESLRLLADIHVALDQHEDALQQFQLGRRRFPFDPGWLRGLADAYKRLNRQHKYRETLEALSQHDMDDPQARRELLDIAVVKKDFEAVVRYGYAVLHIEPADAATHAKIGAACLALGRKDEAIRFYEYAVELNPASREFQSALRELKER